MTYPNNWRLTSDWNLWYNKKAQRFDTPGITTLGSSLICTRPQCLASVLQNCTSQLLGDSKEDSRGVDEQCHLVVEGKGPHKLAIKHLGDIVLAAVQAEVAEADLDSNRPSTPTIVHHSNGKVAGWGDRATPELHFASLKIFRQPCQVTHLHTADLPKNFVMTKWLKMIKKHSNSRTPWCQSGIFKQPSQCHTPPHSRSAQEFG